MTENNIAVYIRLSQTDKNKKDTEESNSITIMTVIIIKDKVVILKQ